MATSQYATTSETTNVGRASRVLLGPCSAQLRDLLRDHVPPQTFPQIIRQKMANHKWTKTQRDLILPSTGQYSGNYSDFDISLLYTLLRNLCNIPKHKNGWGKDPDPNDMSLSANIERIRICRNRLGHAVEFSLSDLEFNDIWSSISTAVIEIDKDLKSNQKHEKDVDFLRYEPMDSEMANRFEEDIRRQYMEDLEIKSLLSEHIKCSDQKLDDIRLNQEMMAKQLDTFQHDQQRRNTIQPTNQFLGFIHWILTVFGIMRILNFFWKKEELMELEAKEISYSSVLLQWENTINQRDNSEVLYLIEYGITRTNHAEEKIRVNSCAFILENLKHSTEYEVQVKAVSPSGEKQHSKKIKFKTEALGKLEYTEITETSILLKWEPKKHTRGEDSAYFVEYETTQPDIKTERVEVKSCEYRLEKLRHSTEYRVQIKVKTDSGETEHTDKIIFETRRHTARGLSETEIQTFERDLKKSKIRLKNVRLMAIGHQGVGKTTLLHRLRNLDSNPSEAELSTISPTKSIKTDLNYAVCNKRGDIICLGEDDICRRKLGMSLEEKEKQTAQKKEVKKSNEDGPMQGDTSSYPAKDTKSEKTIEKQTSTRLTNEDTATEINTDSSLVEDVGPSTDTVKSHSSVKTDEYTDRTPSEIASQSTHANESEESEKKESVIGDELAQDLGKILKEAQVGTDDEFFISYWDFAGEDAYHDTHVAFMSSDAVYLLLFNAAELVQEANGESKRSQEEHLRFWLQNIASLRSENISTPPVIVIGTHMDELDEKSVPDIRSKVEDIVRQLAKDQGALENLYKIYLKNLKRDGITDIWEGIKCAKEIQEHWNKEVPSKMQILEYILTLEKKKTNSSYSSSTQDIRASWNKIGDTSEVDDDLNLYLKMLSDSGSILFLEHDDNVVLDISWIIKCFANIFAPSKEISEATKCRLKEPRIHEDVFREVMLYDEKGENITLKSFLTLGLMVKSNGYITVPAYLPQNRDELVSMREIITKNKKTQKIEISSKLSIFFERKNAAKVNIPLSTLFFNSILVVLIDSLQRKGGGKTLSRAQKSTCLTSIRRTSGILDDNQVYGLIYEMKEGTLYLLVYSLDRDSLPTNLLQDIISKINMLNNAYHKKPLEMKFEISEGYTVPFKSEKANEWMQHWTSKCSDCGEWKDIAYQTGQDISFIDDEGWLKGREDLADVVFKCMKCFKSDDNENREITSHGSNDRRGTGSRSQHLVLSERFLGDLASQIGAEWQLLFIELGLTNAELEHIDFDRGFNQVTKNLKALLLWRKKNKERQASEQLRILFEGFQESGRQDLVDKYTEYLDDVILISAYESSDHKAKFGEFKTDSAARKDKTETDIQRHDAEILHRRKQIDDDKSVTASIEDQQARLEQLEITNRTRQDKMKDDIQRHDTEIVNLRQQIEIKQSVTDHKEKFGEFKTDSAARKDKTETDIQRHDAEILHIRKQIDDDKSVTASIEDRQARLEQLEITNRTRQDEIKADIQRHDTVIVNLRQQMEIKQSVTGPLVYEEVPTIMATSKYASTIETTNSSRVSRVLLDPCTDQMRDVLRHYVPPHIFPQVIQRHRLKLPKLTKPQMDLILPRSGHYTGNYNDFDISLLYILLRNICNIPPHTKGWGKDPDPNDKSLAANIERIRNARNKVFGHMISFYMSDLEFNDIWSTIRAAVEGIDAVLNNNQQYEKAVDFLKCEVMDPDLAKKYETKLHEQMKEDTETRKIIEDVEPDVNILREKLIERNNEQTREMSPVTTDGDNLPISILVIRENVKENRKGKKPAQSEEHQEGKKVKSPEDMLTIDGKPVPRVFMLGKAGHGKTTYCKWFLKTWCNTQQPGMSGSPLNKWENALSQFDFVFYIPLLHVDPSRADVTDMICQDILESDPDLQATVKHVLSSKIYRCFIMMDGLDEWKPDQSVIDRLKYKGMPNIDNMSNCVIFTTMRPWKFSEVPGVTNEDRVIEILGLDDAGIDL